MLDKQDAHTSVVKASRTPETTIETNGRQSKSEGGQEGVMHGVHGREERECQPVNVVKYDFFCEGDSCAHVSTDAEYKFVAAYKSIVAA